VRQVQHAPTSAGAAELREDPDDLQLAAYDYELPAEAIAQRPAPSRDDARLMVIDGTTGARVHARFGEIGGFLDRGDVLVVNDARVDAARLRGRKASGGGVEILLLSAEGNGRYVGLLRGSRRAGRKGTTLHFGPALIATVLDDLGCGRFRFHFAGASDLDAAIRGSAQLPLPPYIHRADGPDGEDLERYQTVYASSPGSVAAPTAGLHFTRELIDALVARGIQMLPVTLHVGPATFQPVRSEDLRQHQLEGEAYRIPHETADAIAAARRSGRRVIAVGTTTTRVLEAACDVHGVVPAGEGVARLFLRPGHRFRVVSGLITNFHLPRSSLLMLVSAFLGRRRVLAAYAEALAHGYRFYSYGDAMAIFASSRGSIPMLARST
jgi:S-adenosylmethionine:tRNA ribosyltransferase-isomerase